MADQIVVRNVSVKCSHCSKVFENTVEGSDSDDGDEVLQTTIEHVKTRLGQHLWSSHNIDCDDISDVEPSVTRKRSKPAAAASARSRSPRAVRETGEGRANLFLASVQINLTEFSDLKLQGLKEAVQREIESRHGNMTTMGTASRGRSSQS
jgi:hypothetical protein